MNAEREHDAPDGRIDEIIAEYLQAVEAGQRPDGQAMIDRYPEHGDALREFLVDQAAVPPNAAM